jgi:hypothetical protein
LIHGHWSSHKLGIHEDVDASIFSSEHWIEFADKLPESFNNSTPADDEDILVFPDFMSGAWKDQYTPNRERMTIDILQLARGISQNTFYRTKVRRLLPLVQEIRRKNSSKSIPNVFAMSDDNIIIPMEDEIIAFDTHKLLDKLAKPGLSSLFDPVQRALSQVDSDYINKWFPRLDPSLLNGIINKSDHSGLRIVDF